MGWSCTREAAGGCLSIIGGLVSRQWIEWTVHTFKSTRFKLFSSFNILHVGVFAYLWHGQSLAWRGCWRDTGEMGVNVEAEGLVMSKLGGDVEGVGQWLSSNKGFITREMLAVAAAARLFCCRQAAAGTSRTFNMKDTRTCCCDGIETGR